MVVCSRWGSNFFRERRALNPISGDFCPSAIFGNYFRADFSFKRLGNSGDSGWLGLRDRISVNTLALSHVERVGGFLFGRKGEG
jgi:hypothetical protein